MAVIFSSLVAAGVLAVGLGAAGFGPPRTAAESVTDGTPTDRPVRVAAEPEVVYVEPAPPRQTVVVRKRVTGGSTSRTPSRAVVQGSRDHEDERDEHEREDDGREREHEDEDD
jgi:hypothetical protein